METTRIDGIEVTFLDREYELTIDEKSDLAVAEMARLEAYAPQSHFQVGVCLLTKDGKQHAGWNVENDILNVLHAEANAIGRVSRESREAGLQRITVVGWPASQETDKPTPPCGACRQFLLDVFHPKDPVYVLMAETRGRVAKVLLQDLLPLAFKL